MKERKRSVLIMLLMMAVIGWSGCEDQPMEMVGSTDEDQEEYDLYEGLEQITGTENATVTVRQGEAVGRDAWFEFDIDNIEANEYIIPGTYEGWCIEWSKHIDQNGHVHEDMPMYSTYGHDRWKPLNYFLNIVEDLKEEDFKLTFREVQAVIWSIMEGPRFDLNELPTSHLPHRLRSDGEINFDLERVLDIVSHVRENAEGFNYDRNKRFALFIKNRDESQDIMVPVDPPEDPGDPDDSDDDRPTPDLDHGFLREVTPSGDPAWAGHFMKRYYPAIQADWEGPGGDSRWLGWNLGAYNRGAESWYFQFDDPQGHIWQTPRTFIPGNNTILPGRDDNTGVGESHWEIGHDPCRIAFGGSWRLPTVEEWRAVVDAGAAYKLQLLKSGYLDFAADELIEGSGIFWSSTRVDSEVGNGDNEEAFALIIGESIEIDTVETGYGATIRCIEE